MRHGTWKVTIPPLVSPQGIAFLVSSIQMTSRQIIIFFREQTVCRDGDAELHVTHAHMAYTCLIRREGHRQADFTQRRIDTVEPPCYGVP